MLDVRRPRRPAGLACGRLPEVEVRDEESWYLLRTALKGVAGKVLQAVGVAPPPSVRPLTVVPSQAPGTAVP